MSNADVELLVLRRLIGETGGSDLRRAVGAVGNHALVHRVLAQTLDGLDANNTFMLGLVRQHRRARDITDSIDA